MSMGSFDAYQQSCDEKKYRAKYEQYLKDNDPADVMVFEDYCDYMDKKKNRGAL